MTFDPDAVPVPDRRLVDSNVARRLIARQFPQWAHLPVRPVPTSGWDNQTFHLGDRMSIRLPTAREYALAVDKEHRWLPILAARVPLPISVPLAKGEPDEEFAFHWSVYEWLDGEPASIDTIGDMTEFADGLAGFLVALRHVAPVRDSFPLSEPGLDYLVGYDVDGELAGFVGLWDQHRLKQLRVTVYSPRLAVARTVVNAVAPLVRAPRLPPPGGELRYRTVVNACAPDPGTLRELLRHGCDRLRGDYSFLTIGLDTRDPLTRALAGMLAQPTDVGVVTRGGVSAPDGDRPVHFEIATV